MSSSSKRIVEFSWETWYIRLDTKEISFCFDMGEDTLFYTNIIKWRCYIRRRRVTIRWKQIDSLNYIHLNEWLQTNKIFILWIWNSDITIQRCQKYYLFRKTFFFSNFFLLNVQADWKNINWWSYDQSLSFEQNTINFVYCSYRYFNCEWLLCIYILHIIIK